MDIEEKLNKSLSSKDRAGVILKYHELLKSKTSLLAECLGIKKKSAYNLVYASKRRIAESTKKREEVAMAP